MNNRYEQRKLDADREAEEALKRNNAETLRRMKQELAEKRGTESRTIGELEDYYSNNLKENNTGRYSGIDTVKDEGKEQGKGKSRKKEVATEPRNNGKYQRTRDWLLILLIANVPIIGWIPLVYWIFARRSTPDKVAFAKAMLIYQLILTFISFCILYVGVQLIVIIFEYFLNNIIGGAGVTL